MRGVILAAGSGTRLNGSQVVRPKCLARFGSRRLIELQLASLRACGIDDITVVVGFEADLVRRSCGPGLRFIDNPDYEDTNSLYSLWLARALLGEGFVVMNCDVLFHPALLRDLLSARHENALLVSFPGAGDPEFGDEEMKVQVHRGRVVDIRKDMEPDDVDGENVGIVKFGEVGARRLVTILDRLVASGSLRDWAPRAFADFAALDALYAIGTRGLPWTEIDTPEDYDWATRRIFPAIEEAVAKLAPALRKGA